MANQRGATPARKCVPQGLPQLRARYLVRGRDLRIIWGRAMTQEMCHSEARTPGEIRAQPVWVERSLTLRRQRPQVPRRIARRADCRQGWPPGAIGSS